MKSIIKQFQSGNFSALAGSRLKLQLPIRQAILDKVAAEVVRQEDKLESLRLEPQADNRLAIHLETIVKIAIVRKRLKRTLYLALPAHSEPASNPILSMPIVGGVSAVEGIIMDVFEKQINQRTPDFVRFHDECIEVNLRAAMAEQGFAALADGLREIDIQTAPGEIIVHVKAALD